MIVFAAIMPHPPESVSGIGNPDDFKAIQKTLDAFGQLRIGLEQADPETIVIISPHAHMEKYSFAINSASELSGNFMKFGLNETHTYANDIGTVDGLEFACLKEELLTCFHQDFLDHGSLIPLYHLAKNIKPKIVQLSFSFMSYNFHYRYGEILRSVIDSNINKRVAIIASGDLSHSLSPKAPAGFLPEAREFDQMVLRYLRANDIASIIKLDQRIAAGIAECGMRAFVILLGALHGRSYEFKLLSYENPLGIGYLTARLV